ncbi:MAG TPA: NAD-dependent epimerase/dehydratase family protein [Polyangiaceae bacterium]|nr:NAD-dependent epimerase/dehydratase family protein [Polyangiaceae bacterium]
MKFTVLVTGGAGFIGSYVADELLAKGYRVRALDNLSPQVHGPGARRPAYLDDRVELAVGDVRDERAVAEALDGVDAVVHLAAAVGVGQSMYQIAEYTSVNNLGTAVLLQALSERPVKRLVVASSMSIYGEGRYVDAGGVHHEQVERGIDQLREGRWDPCDEAGQPLTPVATPEHKQPALTSVYALSKYDQERLCLITGRAYGIPTVALRFFNTYGPRQALENPYTGVLAIFAARILNGRPPLIFEDGQQQRDFVSVHDVARACRLALEGDDAPGHVLNIGSGRPRSVAEVASRISKVLGRPDLGSEITGRYRMGDIRHCYADISRARRVIGYEPSVDLDAGLAELGRWLERQRKTTDRSEQARRELESRGLTV